MLSTFCYGFAPHSQKHEHQPSLEKEPLIPHGLRAATVICITHKGGATGQKVSKMVASWMQGSTLSCLCVLKMCSQHPRGYWGPKIKEHPLFPQKEPNVELEEISDGPGKASFPLDRNGHQCRAAHFWRQGQSPSQGSASAQEWGLWERKVWILTQISIAFLLETVSVPRRQASLRDRLSAKQCFSFSTWHLSRVTFK